MSIYRSALNGMAWFAASSWLQFVFSLVSFLIVIRHVPPALVGAFNAGAAVTAFVDIVVGPSLSLSLGQRENIERRQVNATFWVMIVVSIALVVGAMLASERLLTAMHAPAGRPLLLAVATVWPLTILTSLFSSLLSRAARFAQLSRIAVAAGLLGSLASIVTVLAGGGVWALVIGDMTFRVTRFVGTARALRFRAGPPRDLKAIGDLLSFNLMTLLTLVLAYLDIAAPRLLTGVLLGPAALGYLSLGQRGLDLLTQLALNPIAQVMMVSIARLRQDLPGMRRLITTVYRIATAVAYPITIAAIVLAPSMVPLLGPQWQPAVLTIQIMLLVALRTATGTFNAGILQGVGRLGGSIAGLAIGLAMQVLFVPLGARYGAAGVAAAILARTLGTWPLGCWLVRRATGLAIRDQLRSGRAPLLAALAMAGAMWLTGRLIQSDPLYSQVAIALIVGVVMYPLVFVMLAKDVRYASKPILRAIANCDFTGARRLIMALTAGDMNRPMKAKSRVPATTGN